MGKGKLDKKRLKKWTVGKVYTREIQGIRIKVMQLIVARGNKKDNIKEHETRWERKRTSR